jgi:hypothetical protein
MQKNAVQFAAICFFSRMSPYVYKRTDFVLYRTSSLFGPLIKNPTSIFYFPVRLLLLVVATRENHIVSATMGNHLARPALNYHIYDLKGPIVQKDLGGKLFRTFQCVLETEDRTEGDIVVKAFENTSSTPLDEFERILSGAYELSIFFRHQFSN